MGEWRRRWEGRGSGGEGERKGEGVDDVSERESERSGGMKMKNKPQCLSGADVVVSHESKQ